MSYKQMNQKTKQYMKKMFDEQPEKMKAFKQFMNKTQKGILDPKTKALITIGMAIKGQCTYCISLHVKKALDAGATKQELLEVVWLATLMGGGPSLMYGQEVLEIIEEFE
ncbi:MAG: hypothetical protein MAG795_00031 [Candidatus Woesearchaeota archaeon]|nr:hypothetical protein [Candidatus Woesearchaeota archaeon]